MSDVIGLTTRSVEQTVAVGEAVARVARPGDVIGLSGELGAGKTQFTRGLAQGLGVDPTHVSSPTFVLVQEYEPTAAGGPVLVHIDAYRLGGPEELESIGWAGTGEELREGAVVAVEWAELVAAGFGDDWLEVRLAHAPDGRQITLSPHGSWNPRIHLLRRELAPLLAEPKPQSP